MTLQHMRLAVDDDGIAIVTLDHAGSSANVIDDQWMEDFEQVLVDLLALDDLVGVIVVSAKSGFLAGADLRGLAKEFGTMTPVRGFTISQRISGLFRHLETLGGPVVAAINGPALGGGLELALACHYRVASDAPGTVLGLPEVNLGLLPGAGGTQRLPRMIGVQKALHLLLGGRSINAAEALAIGVIDAVVPVDGLLAAARHWFASSPKAVKAWDLKGYATPEVRGLMLPEVAAAYSMAAAGVVEKTGFRYPAPISILSCVFEGMQLPFDRGLQVESKYFGRLIADGVAQNVIRTTFLARQAAHKGERHPAAPVRRSFAKVGVIGAGMMGSGIAYCAAKLGMKVVLLDRSQTEAEKGKGYSEKVLARQLERGAITGEGRNELMGRIRPTAAFADLTGCDIVIEAVFEDAMVKAEIIRKADAVLDSEAIYASNTSTIPITDIARNSVRPCNVIGLHFFSPAERMELVEVIRGRETTDSTLAGALDFLRQLRKTPIVVNDGRGFYTSRVVQRFILEGAAMLAEGVEPARIENAATSAGFPVGPLALLDEVSIALPLKIVEQSIAGVDHDWAALPGIDVLLSMQGLKRLGRKSGAGFFDYNADGTKRLWAGLRDIFPSSSEQPDQDELKRRFLLAQAVEAARCLEEGILETPTDADIGAVLGWGYPSWTGGPLSYIDMISPASFVRQADALAERHGDRFVVPALLRDMSATGGRFYEQRNHARLSNLEPTI